MLSCMRLNRRQFMGTSVMGTVLTGASNNEKNARASHPTEKTPSDDIYREAARDVPIVERTDVTVCGAGPAGIAAALAAARLGAKTRLIEANGCLGGIWTAGLLSWILDTRKKGGLLQQIMSELDKRKEGYVNKAGYSFGYDAEAMKLLLERMCAESGVNVRLHTQVVSAAKDNANCLRLAITESKSGREAWAAKAFVDATGDGDLAARAGCGFDLGRKEDGRTQPMSMMAILTGVQYQQIKKFVRGTEKDSNIPKRLLLAEIRRGGMEPSYSKPTLFRIYDNLFCLAANHEYDYVPTDAADLTRATLDARAEINKIVDALRGLGGVWKDLRLVATNEHIGIREGRRIHGHYTVSEADLANGARHEDAVCRVYFGVDVHSPSKSEGKGIARTGVRSKPYDIPLRALIARDVDGLLTAGRCISGDFVAHSSYRVTGCAVAMGQAAGVAATLAALNNRLPQDLPWSQIQTTLNNLNAQQA
jgi:hypothetical protein